jgi:hypothetical protein
MATRRNSFSRRDGASGVAMLVVVAKTMATRQGLFSGNVFFGRGHGTRTPEGS